MISVVIPIYNVEKYIDRCITSILNQTYNDTEIVLVDDGSTDNSGMICDKYSVEYPNIKVIHIPNGGVSNARNIGIKNCTKEWVTFVDADDYLEERHLENLFSAAQNDEDLVVCDYRVVTESGDIKKERILNDDFPSSFNRFEALEDMGRGTSIWGYVWNKLFKTETIVENELLFNTDIKIWEDMLFCAEYIACCKSVTVVPISSYNYVVREGSAVNTKSFELKATKYTACEKFETLLEKFISNGIVDEDTQFATWVRTVFAETGLDGVLSGQFENGIYDKELLFQYLDKVDKYKSYITFNQKIKLMLLKVCPYIIYLIKRK